MQSGALATHIFQFLRRFRLFARTVHVILKTMIVILMGIANNLQKAPLRHHVTPTGLVFTTLSEDTPSFHEYFPELEPLLQRVDFTKLPYKRSIKYEGRFNWKTMYAVSKNTLCVEF